MQSYKSGDRVQWTDLTTGAVTTGTVKMVAQGIATVKQDKAGETTKPVGDLTKCA